MRAAEDGIATLRLDSKVVDGIGRTLVTDVNIVKAASGGRSVIMVPKYSVVLCMESHRAPKLIDAPADCKARSISKVPVVGRTREYAVLFALILVVILPITL